MALDWMDVSGIPFRTLLLLEAEQIGWLPGWLPEPELGVALRANPEVAWFLRNKNPGVGPWVDRVLAGRDPSLPVRDAELAVLRSMVDLVVYAVDPQRYADLPFLGWDDAELTALVDFAGRTVIDVGAGAGRLAFVAAHQGARAVFAVEPVGRLRRWLKERARGEGLHDVYAVDGLITDLPFPAGFADVVLGGYVFGDEPERELAELRRVTRPGGTIALVPGGPDRDGDRHRFLVDRGLSWGRFEEPGEGLQRKYWLTLPSGPASGAPAGADRRSAPGSA